VASLHITNGDHAGDKLRTFVDGPLVISADVLHEGPCRPVDGNAWHEMRARFLASTFDLDADTVRGSLAETDRAIQLACGRGDRVVLWFEHDLFDQLQIIRTLDLIGRSLGDQADAGVGAAARHPDVSLICIDRFPGVERFVGLGQLTKEQLATLTGTGATVTTGHFRLASEAWAAFRSPDPRALLRVAEELGAASLPVSEGGPALPFLGAALLRLLAEYPSAANGLSRTEELALTALIDGPSLAGELFTATQSREARPFIGDSTFFDRLTPLASARVPLVTIDGAPAAGERRLQRVAITAAGRDELAGRADSVRLNGIDVWRGGVRLAGSDDSPWRWDGQRETLVS
jgi:hypothetical protein